MNSRYLVNFTVISLSYSPGIQGKAILLKTRWFIYYWANTPVRLRDVSCTIINIQEKLHPARAHTRRVRSRRLDDRIHARPIYP